MNRYTWVWPGAVGIAGGLLLAGSDVLIASRSDAQAGFGADQPTLWLVPLGLLLVLVSLRGLHRLHGARHNWAERWGFRAAAVGLAIEVLGAALMTGSDSSSGAGRWAILLSFFGVVFFRLGLVVFSVGVVRARILPPWMRAVLLSLAGALMLSLALALARVTFPSLVLAVGAWVGWAFLGGGLILHRELIASLGSTSKPFSIREVGGAFVSKATLVSAVVSVGVLTLEWEWYVGALVVLLLYAHELGHVIAALVRGVAVHRAPFFLPGLGAFVQTAPGATHWDDVWVSLGGPLFGGACALAVKVAGVSQGSAALMQAGDVGLWLNVINLAPFSPLDGGRVATRTGWLGLALTVTLGVFLLTRGVDFILIALIGYGAWQAFAAARTLRIRWSTQLGVLAIYLGSVMLLLVAAVASGPATLQRAPRPDWLPGLSEVFSFMFWFYVAGSFVVPYALADARGARTRYGLLAVFGWTRFVLNGQHWIIPLCGALFAEACGLGGLRWVEGSIARLARQGDPRAGEAASLAFDSLRRQGRNAEQWLMGIAPVLKAGGPRVLGQTYLALIGAGYRSMATTLLRHSLASGELAEELGPRIANDYAWQLLGNGAAAEALPYARAAATVSPESPNILDTLGQVLLVLGEAEAAEQPLRASLVLRNRPGTRFALARSLAAQGRIAEAIAEGEAALEPAAGNWSSTEITVEQARAEIQQWRTAAVAVE